MHNTSYIVTQYVCMHTITQFSWIPISQAGLGKLPVTPPPAQLIKSQFCNEGFLYYHNRMAPNIHGIFVSVNKLNFKVLNLYPTR